jgi:hypothetical protein
VPEWHIWRRSAIATYAQSAAIVGFLTARDLSETADELAIRLRS